MKDLIRMNQLAGLITASQARKMMTVLNENKIPGVNVEVLEDIVELSGDSGDYSGFIEDDGTVSFSVIYEDEDDRDGMEFDDENWKSILGNDHVFVKIANAIDTKVEAIDDYVMINVKADDLTNK